MLKSYFLNPNVLPAFHQEKQIFSEPLTWRYPNPPAEEEPHFPPNFELRVPTPAESVSVLCGENTVRVEAKKDLMGIGKPVLASDVTLGGFTLFYTPSPLGSIVRGRDLSINIQCHYQRKHDVSSGALKPDWSSYIDSKESEDSLSLSLQLMSDDWQFPRPVNEFLLGDMMKFEASVKQLHHTPLRVNVESCVATVVPNPDATPRYGFLFNSGCLLDSKLTGSSSRFLPRTHDDKLQFEVEAFRFEHDEGGMLYITCSLRAVAATAPISATDKACSFSNGWREASGNHRACSCCDSDCGHVDGILGKTSTHLRQNALIGPIVVKESSQMKNL
ncbi:Zona pellucida sperm-binding protein 3 [Oryzias melastigma]|uniref:Zona pellucida sperm-binding protein 3 n=1 Tax=Oryzias melastigma TaxID=30732 RepID=A0A834BX95_ORYME|nr:Zona pellucida sperm-binding protein 3 [Oryzias melastigma]